MVMAFPGCLFSRDQADRGTGKHARTTVETMTMNTTTIDFFYRREGLTGIEHLEVRPTELLRHRGRLRSRSTASGMTC